ncbi:MAG: hypothetical protein AAF688_01940 [Bacteroidota bacterium]
MTINDIEISKTSQEQMLGYLQLKLGSQFNEDAIFSSKMKEIAIL